MNISDVLTQLNVPWIPSGSHQHVREGWVGTDCPRCTPNAKHWRLGFSLNGRGASCWQCGKQNVFEMLCELSNAPKNRVVELLKSISVGRRIEKQKTHHQMRYPKGVGRLLRPHIEYLKQRGFDPDEIQSVWGVKGIGFQSRLPWRLFLPVTLNHVEVSWTTRQLHNEGTRYISAKPEEEEVPLKTLLYGEDFVQHAIVVVEGPTDVWRIGKGCVCTFGTAYTQAQVNRISKYPTRVICFDAEPAAQSQAIKLCRELQALPGETYRVVLSGKDAASTSRKEIRELRARFLS